MRTPRNYLAEIGRRGGIRSRRILDSATARRMVATREARRAARRALENSQLPRGEAPADTAPAAQAVQDALWHRMSPAHKLETVAGLSRMVDHLSIAGLRARFPHADEQTIQLLRSELRLGASLAAAVERERRKRA